MLYLKLAKFRPTFTPLSNSIRHQTITPGITPPLPTDPHLHWCVKMVRFWWVSSRDKRNGMSPTWKQVSVDDDTGLHNLMFITISTVVQQNKLRLSHKLQIRHCWDKKDHWTCTLFSISKVWKQCRENYGGCLKGWTQPLLTLKTYLIHWAMNV